MSRSLSKIFAFFSQKPVFFTVFMEMPVFREDPFHEIWKISLFF